MYLKLIQEEDYEDQYVICKERIIGTFSRAAILIITEFVIV